MRAKENKRFFAVVDVCCDTNELKSQLDHLSLDYQKITVSQADNDGPKLQETKTIDTSTALSGTSKVKFGELKNNICLSSAECLIGAYKRESLIKN